jgi:hypothetical protein
MGLRSGKRIYVEALATISRLRRRVFAKPAPPSVCAPPLTFVPALTDIAAKFTAGLIVSLVTDVVVINNAPLMCPPNASCWQLIDKNRGVRLYSPNVEGKMDWRINPWEQPRDAPDVAWLLRTTDGNHIAHFSDLNTTVGDAAEALHAAFTFAKAGGQQVFSPQHAILLAYDNERTKQWGRSALLSEVYMSKTSQDGLVRCRFV